MTAIVPNNLSEGALSVEGELTQRLQTAVSQIIAGTDDARRAATVDEFTPSTQILAEQTNCHSYHQRRAKESSCRS